MPNSDDHQRVVLKVTVKLPASFIHTDDDQQDSSAGAAAGVEDSVNVDVMTSHFR